MITLPKISVFTVVKNAARTLEKAIQSVLEQNYPHLEYLVLDAASDDGTVDIIKRHASHIAFWRSHRDDGINASYNEAIARATGDIIGILNADDWYEPGILLKIGQAFAQDPTLDMVSCLCQMVEQQADGSFQQVKFFDKTRMKLSYDATPAPNARFYKRSLFTTYGNFLTHHDDGSPFFAADLEFILRLARHRIHECVLPHLGYTYLAHPHSLTMSSDQGRNAKLYAERVWIAEHFLKHSSSLPFAFKKRLRRWHRRGTTRQCMDALRHHHTRQALVVAQKGLAISPFLWPVDMLRLALKGRST